mmetsp:Transcript_32000/g.71104  ORF Transcript_32000/g.71104 Transcript_32000/m.71104 type:complete len:95 (-) Transcript_32000:1653-1937(-)
MNYFFILSCVSSTSSPQLPHMYTHLHRSADKSSHAPFGRLHVDPHSQPAPMSCTFSPASITHSATSPCPKAVIALAASQPTHACIKLQIELQSV